MAASAGRPPSSRTVLAGVNPFFLEQRSSRSAQRNRERATSSSTASVPPSCRPLHQNALSASHGNRVEFGNLFGTLPGGGTGGVSTPAPVVINEFLVKPPAGESESIEGFNTTGSPIDLSGWKLMVTNGSYESDFTFPDGTTLPAAGFVVDSTATTICDVCLLEAQPGIGTESRVRNRPLAGSRAQLVGEDFLFDEGGVIQLLDTSNTEVDRVGYGNPGGAPISCPLVVPAGARASGRLPRRKRGHPSPGRCARDAVHQLGPRLTARTRASIRTLQYRLADARCLEYDRGARSGRQHPHQPGVSLPA
jgi:hypothetical protein